jgi:hypothetical protein
MHARIVMTSLIGGLLLVSCGRQKSESLQEGSIEQRVADLEKRLNGGAVQISEGEARKQYERDLVELEKMGMIQRAQRDMSARLSNTIIESWTIRYHKPNESVWCDVRYRLPGHDEVLQQEFGYTRKLGTNWSLIWGFGGKPE